MYRWHRGARRLGVVRAGGHRRHAGRARRHACRLYPGVRTRAGADGDDDGTTVAGGLPNSGTIFKSTAAGVLGNVHVFTGKADGAMPAAGLTLGKDGNFYGTASGGGANGNGTIFKLTPAGALTVLQGFSAQNASSLTNADGTEPMGSLIQAADGNFYGTAFYGGPHGGGTVFKLTPAGAFTTLYSFGVKTDGSDGFNPHGNLYGTTAGGGTNGGGKNLSGGAHRGPRHHQRRDCVGDGGRGVRLPDRRFQRADELCRQRSARCPEPELGHGGYHGRADGVGQLQRDPERHQQRGHGHRHAELDHRARRGRRRSAAVGTQRATRRRHIL